MDYVVLTWQGTDNSKDLILPENSKFVLNTPFLEWTVYVPRGVIPPAPRALAPGWRSIPQWKALLHFGYPL